MFDGLDDPRKQMLLAMGLGLLGNQSGNVGQDIGRAGLLGMNAFNTGQARQARLAEEKQQAEMRAMQMAQLKQQQEAAQRQQQAVQQFMQSRPDLAQRYAVDPQGAMKAAFPERKVQFAPNGQVVDMNALQPGQDFGNQPDWMNPAYQEWALRRAKAGAPSVSVNATQENAFDKEYGKALADSYGNLMKGDLSASSKLNNLSRLESLLKSSGETGKLTPAILDLKQVADSLGMKGIVKDTDNFQVAAKALSNQMALELRNPAGGAGMPGALSDKDREFLVGMTAGIDKMPNANAMIIETQKRVAKREKEVARLARDYRKKHGRFDEGFYQELAQFSEANPLFADLTGPAGNATDTQALVDEARRRGLIK